MICIPQLHVLDTDTNNNEDKKQLEVKIVHVTFPLVTVLFPPPGGATDPHSADLMRQALAL